MTPELVEKYLNNPNFKALAYKRHRLRVQMISAMMLVFGSYLVAWGFFPELVNYRIPVNGPVSLGVWFCIFVVLFAILLSGYYTMFAGKKLDALNEKLLQDFNHDD